MKKFIVILACSISIIACKKDKDKAAQLAELKKEYQSIGEKIKKLDAELNAGKPTPAQINAKTVGFIDTQIDTLVHKISLQGKVEGDNNVNVSPKLPGTISSVLVRKGQKVSAGQTLATLDAGVVKQQIEALRSQLDFADNIYQKQKNLWTQGIGSEVQYLTAQNNVTALKKQIATINEQYGMYKITSPISGTVDEVMVKDGESAAPGFPCMRIVNLGSLKVTAQVADTYIGSVKPGTKVFIEYPDLAENDEALIRASSSVIDPISRSFNIELRPNNIKNLKPNMIAKLDIVDYVNFNNVVIPVSAVQSSPEGDNVFIAKEQGNGFIAEKRKVVKGKSDGINVEIVEGLEAGVRLITLGSEELANGDAIKF